MTLKKQKLTVTASTVNPPSRASYEPSLFSKKNYFSITTKSNKELQIFAYAFSSKDGQISVLVRPDFL